MEMQKVTSATGLGTRGLLLFVVLLVSGCSGVQSVLDPAAPDARLIARLSWWMFASGAFVLIVTLGMLLVAVNLQRGGDRIDVSFRTSAIIVAIGGVAAPVIAIIAVGVSGVLIGDQAEGAEDVGLTVEVHGNRWWWEFRYLDEAGEVTAVTANELHLPVGERAHLLLKSDDVIHSFWVPNLQGKTDLIPGVTNSLYTEPEVAGTWRAQCAEYCGIQHALMAALVVAEPREAFDAWLAQQAAPAVVTEHPGLDVFLDYECGECHAIRGTAADGQKGPDLTHLASRETLAAATLPNTPGNLGGWITSTHKVKPGALMPPTAPEQQELFALIEYLGMLE